MTLSPLIAAPYAVQLHTAAAIAALLTGAAILFLPKGVGPHRALGTLAALALLVTALSSFWIFGIYPGRPSYIHLLSLLTLYCVVMGVYHRRQGNIRAHKSLFVGAYLGLAGAALFTMTPGRIMNAVIFSG